MNLSPQQRVAIAQQLKLRLRRSVQTQPQFKLLSQRAVRTQRPFNRQEPLPNAIAQRFKLLLRSQRAGTPQLGGC